ncbi:hypothetical protein L210DRAFT_365155 [Boletus edulis BED1]|uniref:Uncharacterized protein n=1 Tax=Boletus edulis BED1 TaxID=1328754 RepID=A0AAD4BCJ8_BOLED|nr:hypothetical protein L210DRAFT_365155 [Boletus edulis BED1]
MSQKKHKMTVYIANKSLLFRDICFMSSRSRHPAVRSRCGTSGSYFILFLIRFAHRLLDWFRFRCASLPQPVSPILDMQPTFAERTICSLVTISYIIHPDIHISANDRC